MGIQGVRGDKTRSTHVMEAVRAEWLKRAVAVEIVSARELTPLLDPLGSRGPPTKTLTKS